MKMMKTFLACVIVGLMSFLGVHSAAALSLGFVPSSQNVVLGDPASVDVVLSGFTATYHPVITAFDLEIDFDSGILDASSVSYGPSLGDLSVTFTDTSFTAGEVAISELSLITSDAVLASLQAGASITLATITFQTTAVGTSPLVIAPFDNITGLFGTEGIRISAETFSGAITVTSSGPAVPEPCTTALLGIGLAGLAARTILRRSKET